MCAYVCVCLSLQTHTHTHTHTHIYIYIYIYIYNQTKLNHKSNTKLFHVQTFISHLLIWNLIFITIIWNHCIFISNIPEILHLNLFKSNYMWQCVVILKCRLFQKKAVFSKASGLPSGTSGATPTWHRAWSRC